MATRFLKNTDYAGYIKPEIFLQITGAALTADPSDSLLRAESTAIATIKNFLSGRYDCGKIFTIPTGDDTRDLWIVKCVMVLALFDIYHQTGVKDVPEHRRVAYDDTIQWLKDAGRGDIETNLPPLPDDVNPGDVRFNSRPTRSDYRY